MSWEFLLPLNVGLFINWTTVEEVGFLVRKESWGWLINYTTRTVSTTNRYRILRYNKSFQKVSGAGHFCEVHGHIWDSGD